MPGNAALLLIDLQQAFCSQEGSVARQGRDMTACIEAGRVGLELAGRARAAGIQIIWTRMVLRADYADAGLIAERSPGLLKLGGLRAGTPDIELIATPDPADIVIDKPRNSAFFGSPLDSVLRARKIERLYVGGVTTPMCVESTVRDAGQRDYPTFVIPEACGDFNAERHRAALEIMAFGFATLLPRAEFEAGLRA